MNTINVDFHARIKQIKSARAEENKRVLARLLFGILIVLGVIAMVLALTSCAPNICEPGVSFNQVSAEPLLFDAYRDGARIATNVTLDAIRACGGAR